MSLISAELLANIDRFWNQAGSLTQEPCLDHSMNCDAYVLHGHRRGARRVRRYLRRSKQFGSRHHKMRASTVTIRLDDSSAAAAPLVDVVFRILGTARNFDAASCPICLTPPGSVHHPWMVCARNP